MFVYIKLYTQIFVEVLPQHKVLLCDEVRFKKRFKHTFFYKKTIILANKNTKFWKLSLATFLRFS